MRVFIFSLMLCLTVVIQYGCRKGGTYQTFTTAIDSIPGEFKAWTMFMPGSYWVYLNEKTGVTDCTSYKRGPFYNYNNDGVQFMWYYTNSKLWGRFADQAGTYRDAYYKIMLRNGYELLGLTWKTLIDSVPRDSARYDFTYKFIEHLDTLSLNGKPFTQVYHTKFVRKISEFPSPEVDIIYDLYFSKGIGLICFKKSDNSQDTTWSLVRWKTVQ